MVEWFELKTYKQLDVALAAANIALLVGLLVLGYFNVASAPDQKHIDTALSLISSSKLVSLLPIGLVATFWGWFATQILRLHDRIHEPLIRKWRAGYDADFILRALIAPWSDKVPQELYERAYTDARVCQKSLQRLFYRFVGDAQRDSEGHRLFFYSEMARYWFMALVELYTYAGLIAFAYYAYSRSVRLSSVATLSLVLVNIGARVYSNHVLDSAHGITANQVSTIRRLRATELDTEIDDLLRELGMRAGR